MGERCLFCDRPATRYCDEVLALVAGGVAFDKRSRPYAISTMEAMMSGSYTCDAPFCDEHGKQAGIFHSREYFETIDYCAGCLRDPPKRHKPLPLDRIAAIRRERHAKWRRERFAVLPTAKDPDHERR